MKGKSIIVALTAILVLAIERSEAVHCYSCSSNSHCEDPFNPTDVPICTVYSKGVGSCVKARSANGVVRGCFTGTAVKDTCESNSNALVCVCATDYCNEGMALKPTIAIIITASAIYFAIKGQIM